MQSNSREQSRVFPTLGYSVAEVYNLFLSIYPLWAIEMDTVCNLCSELDGVVKFALMCLKIEFELSYTLQLDSTCLFVSMLRGAAVAATKSRCLNQCETCFWLRKNWAQHQKRGRHTTNSCQKYLLCCHQVASDKHKANKLELMQGVTRCLRYALLRTDDFH